MYSRPVSNTCTQIDCVNPEERFSLRGCGGREQRHAVTLRVYFAANLRTCGETCASQPCTT